MPSPSLFDFAAQTFTEEGGPKKRCIKCNKIKDVSVFGKNRRAADGLYAYCNHCSALAAKLYRKKNSEREFVEFPEQKGCATCHAIKSRKEFYYDKTQKDGLNRDCRECSRKSASLRQRSYAERTFVESVTKKKCGSCLEIKHKSFFNKNKYTKNGISHSCKNCTRAQNKEIRAKFPFRQKLSSNTRNSIKKGIAPPNITEEELAEIYAFHNGICDIPSCNSLATDMDHCHITGKVRGFLCNRHNMGLGAFNDDACLLREAASYLEKNGLQ